MAEQYLNQFFGTVQDEICTYKSFCDMATMDKTNIALNGETFQAAGEAIR